jgi:hypothetical protein
MASRHLKTIRDLRAAVECLPRHTRVAMLEGIQANEIIVGAYSSDGGICPMLAAHRHGGRTDFILFARAWDRFAFAGARRARARRATERELRVLVTHLEASLLEDELPRGELGAAIAEHRQLREARQARERSARVARERAARPRPGDPDRSAELSRRGGWAWTRPVRRLDLYEEQLQRTLEELTELAPC